MGSLSEFRRGRFGRSDRHFPVELSTIGRKYLRLEMLGQADRKARFTGCRSSAHGDEIFLIGVGQKVKL